MVKYSNLMINSRKEKMLRLTVWRNFSPLGWVKYSKLGKAKNREEP
jgi:hypothetical protein